MLDISNSFSLRASRRRRLTWGDEGDQDGAGVPSGSTRTKPEKCRMIPPLATPLLGALTQRDVQAPRADTPRVAKEFAPKGGIHRL